MRRALALVGPFIVLFGCTTALQAPVAISPKSGADFDHFPRVTELRWEPVPNAVSYGVEVDCFHCCVVGKWCSEVDKVRISASGIKQTKFQFHWVGSNLGRWRVWAVGADGKAGPKSAWEDFFYKR